MEKMNKKKMTFETAINDIVEVDPICGIESCFIREKLMNGCDGRRRFCVFINTKPLKIVLKYCEKRAKIKLQHHSLNDDDNENLKKFDSKFLQFIHLDEEDRTLLFDIFRAAVKLNIKSLYDLVLEDVVDLCDKLSPKLILRYFVVGVHYTEQVKGRYLFLPSNPVWDLITSFYQTHLANSDEKIGIQIRLFDREYVASLFKTRWEYNAIPDTILSCALENKMLPEINTNKFLIPSQGTHKSIAVILTSLTSDYFEKIKKVYWQQSTIDGSIVEVFQPSPVRRPKTGNKWHNMKAWADMYLLSLSDKLITSPGSTFGYVAQGLGGLTPWSLHMPDNETVRSPPCSRAMSMEPCFHVPPPKGCDNRSGIDTGSIVSHVRHCEDFSWGLKLVDSSHF